jgi:hypothetical protein
MIRKKRGKGKISLYSLPKTIMFLVNVYLPVQERQKALLQGDHVSASRIEMEEAMVN